MSETPRTNFVAHESGDAEWNRSVNRFGRMKAHAEIIERELAAAQAQLAKLERALRKAKLGIEHALMFSTMHASSRKTLNEICTEVTSAMKETGK